jgi:hypothetical protein
MCDVGLHLAVLSLFDGEQSYGFPTFPELGEVADDNSII